MAGMVIQKPAENGVESAIVRALGRRSIVLVEIFAKHGEPYFRAGEARVIARLMENGPQVLATGGGAVMNQHTRDLIRIKGISVWLKADLDVLLKRTKRRNDRPLAEKIKDLIPLREPIYAQSDIVVQSRDESHDTIVNEIIAALHEHVGLTLERKP
jgi:shikimate kinase